MSVFFKGVPQRKVILFFNWYESPRQDEIDKCLEMNRNVFDEVVVIEGRPTFKELFDKSQDCINCFCNSDIYFTSVEPLRKIKDGECYAITRKDMLGTPYASGSQDAWVFKGKVKPMFADFYPGMWGCDNRLAYEFNKSGYKVINPALSVELIHLHKTDNRNYTRTKENTVPPPYLLVNP